jgi:hypothetical protein
LSNRLKVGARRTRTFGRAERWYSGKDRTDRLKPHRSIEEETDMTRNSSKQRPLDEEVNARYGRRLYSLVYAVQLSLILIPGCKKTEPAAPAAQPAAVPATPVAVAPTTPVPGFSAAQKIGMFVYPTKNQNHDQQLIDESNCYNNVQQQTGIDPAAPGPQAPSAADVSAAEQQGAADADQAHGGRVKGAGKGALGGAAIGAISGHAGRGAAIGATVGTVHGGRKQRQANEASQEQGAQSAAAQQHQAYSQSKAAYNQKLATFKRGFSACMEAQGYSVK